MVNVAMCISTLKNSCYILILITYIGNGFPKKVLVVLIIVCMIFFWNTLSLAHSDLVALRSFMTISPDIDL